MTAIDVSYLHTWVGRSHTDEDVIASRHARLMAATVDYPEPGRIRDGEPLPPLWHWIYFLEGLPSGELGRDGHPARGGFLPPVPLANRMWAGGRLAFLAPVPLGARVRKTSQVLAVDHKTGRAGDLVFVTVLHELTAMSGELLVREEHDIVYKNASPPAAEKGDAAPPPAGSRCRTFVPTSTTLFRYSALTFNGHRIHYDQDYCRNVEGYDNLVIHGPLTATMLANFAEEAGGRPLRELSYRGFRPALLGETLTLVAEITRKTAVLSARLANGATCMRAEIRFA
ncbi:MAG: acyl-CoA dehydrogenase [Betaproteobacteria bacterium]|nr:acyl-CoA dehydrogenase [Betaproteobacteria bacterium]